MKKVLFYISAGIALLILINILDILITDLSRLTEYGYGYLAGKVILFALFLTIALLTRKYISKSKSST